MMKKKTGFHGDCFVILVAMTLKLPLTSTEKIGNLHLFLCHCRYLDIFLQKCSNKNPLSTTEKLCNFHNFAGCHGN